MYMHGCILMHTNIMGEEIDQSLVLSAVSPVFVQTRESRFFLKKESESCLRRMR